MMTPNDIIKKIDQHTKTPTQDIDHAFRRLCADGARLFPNDIIGYMACLITAGADINKAGGANQRTPIHWAVIKSQPRTLQWLVNQPNANILCKDADGKSPLSLSVDKNDQNMQRILLTELARRCMHDADKLMPQEWENQRITPAEFHSHDHLIENITKIALFNIIVGCFSLAHYDQFVTQEYPTEFTPAVLQTIDQTKATNTKDKQQDYIKMLFNQLRHRYAFHQYRADGKRLPEAKTAYVHALLTNILAEADLLDKVPLMFFTLGTPSHQNAPGLSLLGLGSEDGSMNITDFNNSLLIINPSPPNKRAATHSIPIYSGREKSVYLTFNISELQQLTGTKPTTLISITNQHYIHPRVGSTAYGRYGNQPCTIFMAALFDHFKKLWTNPKYDIAPYLIEEACQIISRINSEPKLQQMNAEHEGRCIAGAQAHCKLHRISESVALAAFKNIPTIANVEEAIEVLSAQTACVTKPT